MTRESILPNPMTVNRPNTATVFLIAQPAVRGDSWWPDLTQLNQFGKVKVLSPVHIPMPSDEPITIQRALAKRLRDFNPQRDYLVWAGGETVVAVMLGVVLADMGVTEFQWLRFERGKTPSGERMKTGTYTVVRVPLPELTPLIESQETDDDEEAEGPYDDGPDAPDTGAVGDRSRRSSGQ